MTTLKTIFAWLISIFYTPLPVTDQAAKPLTTPEVNIMSEPLIDGTVAQPAVAVTQSAPTPIEEIKAGVADFEAALTFVESGVAQLGEAAKDELKELAKKYL
ncbi:hypothetical protein [Ewingella americana]|uniref:Uncharacterized protein n=1 Tax=Ewingella americana TaxID=41202 RepID=A0A502GKB7_9GAMM|nr:hypothetical protein [Ewingella americana]TPG62569.1 hypothetical protein EAH77_08750 [Ewingella americana]